MQPLEQYRAPEGDLILKIFTDDYPENPRQWATLGTMLCFHRRYRLGDETELTPNMFCSWNECEKYLKQEEGAHIVLPLYLYDHSGISISVNKGYPYNDPWDAGQVGFIYTNPEQAQIEQLSDDRAISALEGEVKIYDQFLRGSVFRYELIRPHVCPTCDHESEEFVNGFGGFFGDTIEESGILEDYEGWERMRRR